MKNIKEVMSDNMSYLEFEEELDKEACPSCGRIVSMEGPRFGCFDPEGCGAFQGEECLPELDEDSLFEDVEGSYDE